ncbi:protein phosphatase 4 core regulatory subunit r2 protein [Diplodia corticola]|uniref:Protein phosphatase 4 core regulatory subunit r2 protein n=1 Tax=Diplodia corticola TaxID=236234 RepID=A0A1J9R6K5_9PEZI|nr:protein phosphatase 4 core regulatory subunit r2 protein [Diplodia corticola]OJD35850.1 protein phosphatase 4 core regulatory subunit r2 protein [Diplodia corticola]
MLSGEQLLEQAAKDGSMLASEWPRALEIVLSRLDHIVADEFPTPTIPPPIVVERERSPTPVRPPPPPDRILRSQVATTADKENAPPASSSNTTPNAAARITPSPGPSAQALPHSGSQDANSTSSPTAAGAASGDTNEGNDTSSPPSSGAATPSTSSSASSSLPSELAGLHASIAGALRKQFAKEPPYTVQRLAELVLHPRAHYRFLPPYLRALDRVVSVSSATTVFPLPQAAVPTGTGILNGITPTSSATASAVSPSAAALGSDESLGGALLTPIPWLQNRGGGAGGGSSSSSGGSANGNNNNNNSELVSECTEMVDGPNGAGRIETVSVINGALTTTSSPAPGAGAPPAPTAGGPSAGTAAAATTAESLREAGAVTQGELLRQEQEAGVVPVGQSNPRRVLLPGYSASAAAAASAADGDEQKEGDEMATGEEKQQEEMPHARGPGEVGAEDVGPQHESAGGEINMEAAVGRAPVGATKKDDGEAGEDDDGKKPKPAQPVSPEAEMKDVDDDEDNEAKGKPGDEKAGDKGAKEAEKRAEEKKDDGSKSDTEMTD